MTEEQIQQWHKENSEQFYGLDTGTVKEVLWHLEDARREIETLQQQNKQLIEALEQAYYNLGREKYMKAEDVIQAALQQIQGNK